MEGGRNFNIVYLQAFYCVFQGPWWSDREETNQLRRYLFKLTSSSRKWLYVSLLPVLCSFYLCCFITVQTQNLHYRCFINALMIWRADEIVRRLSTYKYSLKLVIYLPWPNFLHICCSRKSYYITYYLNATRQCNSLSNYLLLSLHAW